MLHIIVVGPTEAMSKIDLVDEIPREILNITTALLDNLYIKSYLGYVYICVYVCNTSPPKRLKLARWNLAGMLVYMSGFVCEIVTSIGGRLTSEAIILLWNGWEYQVETWQGCWSMDPDGDHDLGGHGLWPRRPGSQVNTIWVSSVWFMGSLWTQKGHNITGTKRYAWIKENKYFCTRLLPFFLIEAFSSDLVGVGGVFTVTKFLISTDFALVRWFIHQIVRLLPSNRLVTLRLVCT